MSEVERFELAPGYSIARLINGCWQLTPDHGGGPASESEALRVFAEQVDRGFTTFDCADIYIGVEELLGRFRRSLANPDSIQIHTKYAPNRDALQELTGKHIDAAIDRSLLRLGVEQLDLLQFHWWRYDVPGLDQLTDRLVRAQQRGKIRLLGVTNFDTAHVRDIVEHGAKLVSVQSQYSLLDRRPERQLTGFAAGAGINLLSYGTLGGGFLSDNYRGRAAPAVMNRSLQKYRLIIDEAGGWERFQSLLQELAQIAEKHRTTIAAVATRWALDQPRVAAVILGVGRTSRVAENLRVSTLHLDDDDRQAIARTLRALTVPPGDTYDLERDAHGPHTKIIRMNLHDESESK